MIHMSAYIPKNADVKLRSLLHWSKLRQEQLGEAFLITKDTVLGFLKRQIEHGNWRSVLEVLKGKPMTQAGRYMLSELRSKAVRKLIMRMGLRPVIATALVILLLPIILAKVAGEVIGWIRNRN
ncbi:hypothetical protein [Pontibacter amylolyticus]|uniref:Uncharacterized protein n=1 Tax=Pontibacter amylolyticus TaxID=1424080 RepID=A0ABQ1WI73_9BACT|nr:hypothetical protein [Pontibacter amylolyticus]GGG30248.1 hypothetical protein GCM10011323_37130 [Pontibacter amylolyticus]